MSKPTLITPTAGQRGMTELHYAAYCNDAYEVCDQLRRGAYADVLDDNGWAPLHWSIDMAQAFGEPEPVVSLLLAAGASANAIDQLGISVLMRACERNNIVILERLIRAGADVHLRTPSGATVLHLAASCNFSEGIRQLLVAGADPGVADNGNRTPENIAEQCGFGESVAVLKAAGSQR